MDDTGEPVDPERVYRLNGWIEKIDADNAVVAVYGDKRNDAQRYTQTELTELIGAGETKIPGSVFCRPNKTACVF